MEYNQRAVFCMLNHIPKTSFGREVHIKITAQNVPHDDLFLVRPDLTEFPDLTSPDSAIRRTKKIRFNPFVTFSDIFQITCIRRIPTVQMIKGMVAYGVPFGQQCLIDFRVLPGVIANAEKRRFRVEAAQRFQDPGRDFGNFGKNEISSLKN